MTTMLKMTGNGPISPASNFAPTFGSTYVTQAATYSGRASAQAPTSPQSSSVVRPRFGTTQPPGGFVAGRLVLAVRDCPNRLDRLDLPGLRDGEHLAVVGPDDVEHAPRAPALRFLAGHGVPVPVRDRHASALRRIRRRDAAQAESRPGGGVLENGRVRLVEERRADLECGRRCRLAGFRAFGLGGAARGGEQHERKQHERPHTVHTPPPLKRSRAPSRAPTAAPSFRPRRAGGPRGASRTPPERPRASCRGAFAPCGAGSCRP